MTSRTERAGALRRRIFGAPALPACQICAGPIDGEPNLALQDLGAELGRKFIPTCDSCFADPRLVELDRIPATPVRQPASDGSFEVTLSEARTVAYARSSASQRAASIVGIPAPDRAILVVLEESAGLASALFPAVPQTVPGNAERWHLVDVQALCAAYCRALIPPAFELAPKPGFCSLCRRDRAPRGMAWQASPTGGSVTCAPCAWAIYEMNALGLLTPWTALDILISNRLGPGVVWNAGDAKAWHVDQPQIRAVGHEPLAWIDFGKLRAELAALAELSKPVPRPDVTVSAA